MKKTIILGEYNHPLEQIMRGALAFGRVISKRTILFDSVKEAKETIKNHVCGWGCKVYPLNKKQVELIEKLKQLDNKYILFKDFDNIKE